MLYLNVRYKFAPPESPGPLAGGIVATSAMPLDQLTRRDFKKYPYLQHRLLDPQLYLAGLDPNVARGTVVKLATFPWFAKHGVPPYDSDKHGSIAKWKREHSDDLVGSWKRKAPRGEDLSNAARAAVQTQLDLGCNAIILPGPLTTAAMQNFSVETDWIDAGLQACKELKVTVPVYATIALSDQVLRNIDPTEYPLLHSITNQVAARDQLAGAYLVLEQTSDDQYVCTRRDSLMSMLLIVDDLVRGASRQVVVNYLGTFGPVLAAAGATIWSTGYYVSQRRMNLESFDEKVGYAKPRYFSRQLAGDIGLERDLPSAYKAGLGDKILTETGVGSAVGKALKAGSYPRSVPEWAYRPSIVQAAMSHYTEVMSTFGAELRSYDSARRVDIVHKWLRQAVRLVESLERIGIQRSGVTDIVHQRVWLDVFEEWRQRAGI